MGEAIVGEELPKEAPEPESKSDSLLKELNEIRRRRTDGDKRSMFAKKGKSRPLRRRHVWSSLRGTHSIDVLRYARAIDSNGSQRFDNIPRHR